MFSLCPSVPSGCQHSERPLGQSAIVPDLFPYLDRFGYAPGSPTRELCLSRCRKGMARSRNKVLGCTKIEIRRVHYDFKAKEKPMSRTYRAVQVTQPGKLEVVERTMVEPSFGQVRIRVEACAVYHTDALTVEGGMPGLNLSPRSRS
jgi:hypothetical protein